MFRPLLISLCITSTALADTWTVDDDGKADFDNIQAAVDAASNGDEIIVAPGTYTSTADEVVDMLGKEIWLRSSKGAEVTIIDGEETRRGIYCGNGETQNTIIEGFTIIRGSAYGEYPANCGGGMYCDNSNPTLTDCIFENNTAILGGGMNNATSNPTLTGCTFTGNTANDYGGGMQNYNSNPTLTNCTFIGNTATNSHGGGMENNISSPSLTDCTFADNSATNGGGMRNYIGSNPTLENCTFTNNTAVGGGGMCNEISSNPNLINCTFENNSAGSGGGGALLNIESISSSTIENCYFIGNYAWGGGGAIKNKTNSYGVFSNCYFVSNYGSVGGAVLNSSPMSPIVIFTGCQFRNNIADHAIPPGSNGWAIYSQSTYVIVINTMFCSNDISGSSEPYYVDGGGNTFLGECPDCPDINGDGIVNVIDLIAIIEQWGLTNSPADVDFDGIVDLSDILIVVGNWGPCE